MAPKYILDADFGVNDGLQSTSPHWVVAFARYKNPITYSPVKHASISNDVAFAYAERAPLVIDDQGDCVSVSINAAKNSHTATMSINLIDSGTKYLNEILPGDWVIAHVVYSLDEARQLAADIRAKKKVNGWNSGLKFLGRVSGGPVKNIAVDDNGVPSSSYNIQCVAFAAFDSTILYYPELVISDSAPPSMDKFGPEVSAMIRGHESNEFGAIDINLIVPKLMRVIFGTGAWAGQTFLDEQLVAEPVPLTPNLPHIVPDTILKWLGINKSRGTFADLMRVMVGVQKFTTNSPATNSTVDGGKLFWPDETNLSKAAFRGRFTLMGSFPTEVVPPTTTTPWSFISNYINTPINEPLVTLRPDVNGDIFPFFTIRQTPYTSEVGQEFDLKMYEADIDSQVQQNEGLGWNAPDISQSNRGSVTTAPDYRPPTFSRVPTTRFLELPRWVVSNNLLKQATIGRSDMMRQNLVYVFGTGPGVPFNEYDQFVNSPPIKDNLDIYRNGIRPYMPSVNCFLRDLIRLPTDWRDIMADIVMGQHLTLSGSLTISGIRSPIAPGDNVQFEGIVYHIEALTHACFIDSSGKRRFETRLTISRGIVDEAVNRSAQFPNLKSTDPEGPPQAVTRD